MSLASMALSGASSALSSAKDLALNKLQSALHQFAWQSG